MIRKIIPIALPVLALVGGAFAGDMLRAPAPDAAHSETGPAADASLPEGNGEAAPTGDDAWFKFPTQFFVPLVRQGDLGDVMILTLTLQTEGSALEALSTKEHALRDALLRQLLIHANTGGFDGNFTADRNLATLRDTLLKAAKAATDLPVTAILIEDIARQAG